MTAEGFTNFADRPRRLRLLLDAYGYDGSIRSVLGAVRDRIVEHAEGSRTLAAAHSSASWRTTASSTALTVP